MSRIHSEMIRTKLGKLYELRSFVDEDAEKLQIFFHKSALDSTHTLHYKEKNIPINRIQERIKLALEVPNDLFLGAFDEENIIGQLFFRVPLPDHPWVKHVGEFGLSVLKEYWGKGIGTALLKKMEDSAKNMGIARLEARVRITNARGLGLYKKLGYEIEGVRKKAALINQIYEDEYYIAKFLSDIK